MIVNPSVIAPQVSEVEDASKEEDTKVPESSRLDDETSVVI